MADGADPEEEAFLRALGALGPALLQILADFERVARHLDPSRIASIREALAPRLEHLRARRADFASAPRPDGLRPLAEALDAATEHAVEAGRLFVEGDPAHDPIASVLGAMHRHCLAQQAVFPLRDVLPAFDRFFVEADRAGRLPALAAGTGSGERVGLFNASNRPEQRGGFSLFVPETYSADRAWPLVVALHGGSGHGADFIWSWLREARSRDHILLAPTARGSTWSMGGPDVDARALDAMLDYVAENWRIDAARMLLTGLSDGATYTLLHGLAEASRFTHLAPLSGVLHPANLVNGNIERAAGRRIYLVHGALDWMFPVDVAREARRLLEAAGAELVYREIADLSHAYAREENTAILEWMQAAR